jgi:hypothetical protein
LQVYFLHHRELLGRLSRAGWEVVRELKATAVGHPAFRPGRIGMVQTLGRHARVRLLLRFLLGPSQ